MNKFKESIKTNSETTEMIDAISKTYAKQRKKIRI